MAIETANSPWPATISFASRRPSHPVDAFEALELREVECAPHGATPIRVRGAQSLFDILMDVVSKSSDSYKRFAAALNPNTLRPRVWAF